MDNLNYELPELRAKIGQLQQENEALREDNKQLTEAYYGVINRLKELTSEDKTGRPHQNIMEQIMPTFRFRDKETGEEWDEFFTSNATKYEALEKNPHIEQVPTTFGIVSTTGTIDGKTDDGWKEVLAKASEAHPDSPLADRYGRKSAKDIRTKAVVDKHRSRWRTE